MAKEIATKTKLDTRIAADIAAAMPVANQPAAAKAVAAQVAKKAIVIDTEEVQAAVEQTVEGSADVIVAQASGAAASSSGAAAGGISTTALVVAGVAVAAAAGSSSSSSTPATAPAPAPAATPAPAPTPAGNVAALTTAADAPSLSSGNDTITAAIGTLQGTDIISDGSTTDNDTLNAVLNASSPGTSAPVIVNIENVNLDFKGFGVSYNAASTTNASITASSTQEGNDTATFTNLTSTVKVAASTGVTTLSLGGTNTTLKMSGQTLSSAAGTNLSESLTIESKGAANTLTLAAGQTLGKIVVTGDQALTIKGGLPLVTGKTVTNSSSGALTYEVNTAMSAATANVSKVNASNFNFNVASAMGANAVTMLTGQTATLSKDANMGTTAGTHGFIAETTGVTVTTADVLNVTVGASQAAVTSSGFETVNLKVATTSGTITQAEFTTSADVVVTGSNDLTITTLGANKTLDASTLGGKITVGAMSTSASSTLVGSAGNDSITFVYSTNAKNIFGAAGNDTIALTTVTGGSAISDTILGGAGTDTVNITATAAIAHTSSVTMTGALIQGGDGTDTINFGSSTTAFLKADGTATSTMTLSKISGFENINIFVDAGSSAVTASGAAITFALTDDNVSAGATATVKLNVTDVASFAKSYVLDGTAETSGSLNLSVVQLGTAGTYSTFNVKGGAGADTLSAGVGADTITGGKGQDTIYLNAGGNDTVVTATGDSTLLVDTCDVINGAGTGDIFQLSGVTLTAASSTDVGSGWTVTNGVASKSGSTLADFVSAMTTQAAAGTTSGVSSKTVAYVNGSDLYIFMAGATATGNSDDVLLKLIGSSTNTLSVSGGNITLA